MTPRLHLRCGDDLRCRLQRAGIAGEYLCFADPVCCGPAQDDGDLMAWLYLIVGGLFETVAVGPFDVDLWSARAWESIARVAPAHAEEIAGIEGLDDELASELQSRASEALDRREEANRELRRSLGVEDALAGRDRRRGGGELNGRRLGLGLGQAGRELDALRQVERELVRHAGQPQLDGDVDGDGCGGGGSGTGDSGSGCEQAGGGDTAAGRAGLDAVGSHEDCSSFFLRHRPG